MREIFEDYIGLVFAMMGGVYDAAISVVDKYLWVLSRAFRYSLIASALGVCLVLASELVDNNILLSLSTLVFASVIACWIILATPLVFIVELSSSWAPARQRLRILGFVIVAAAAFAFLALRLPGGFVGAQLLIAILILLLGVTTFGFRPTRVTLGIQMVLTAFFAIVTIMLPQTSGLLGSMAASVDAQIARNLSSKPHELVMSAEVLRGESEGVLPLFKRHDGSPNWWCREDELKDVGFRCFGQPGRDQTTQEELFPISPAVVQAALSNLAAADQRREEEALKEAERIAEAEEEKRRAERAEADRIALLEAERLADERAEAARLEQLEEERLTKQNAERERIAREAASAEQHRVELNQLQQQLSRALQSWEIAKSRSGALELEQMLTNKPSLVVDIDPQLRDKIEGVSRLLQRKNAIQEGDRSAICFFEPDGSETSATRSLAALRDVTCEMTDELQKADILISAREEATIEVTTVNNTRVHGVELLCEISARWVVDNELAIDTVAASSEAVGFTKGKAEQEARQSCYEALTERR